MDLLAHEQERGITICTNKEALLASQLYGKVDPSKLRLNPEDHEYLHWVFDLETYGTDSNAIVPELSAVAFDIMSGEVFKEITLNIDVDSQVAAGRTISASTMSFWLAQKREARMKLCLSDAEFCKRYDEPAPLDLVSAMEYLSEQITQVSAEWAEQTGNRPEPLVWGNGITFDLGKTISLFEYAGVALPWQFWAERDARTLMMLAPMIKKVFSEDFRGIPHYGLDDCKHELRYLAATYIKVWEMSKEK